MKKIFFRGVGSGEGRVGGGGGQGRCERRSKVFVKIHFFFGGGDGSGWGSGWGVGLVGVRVDVNTMLGVGGDVGYGGYEPRIECIVQCTKRYCTMLRKLKKCGGGVGNILTKTLSLY